MRFSMFIVKKPNFTFSFFLIPHFYMLFVILISKIIVFLVFKFDIVVSGALHVLYTPVELVDGQVLYYNKYAGK